MRILLGNLCCLLALAADAVSAAGKTPRSILLFQSLSQLFYGISALFLRGYSAAVQNFVSILRNLTALRKACEKWVAWLFIALGVGLGLLFNNLGAAGLLPVIANLEYSLAIFRFREDQRSLKLAFLVCVLLYTVFNVIILNIVGAVSNVVVLITTTAFLIRDSRKQT